MNADVNVSGAVQQCELKACDDGVRLNIIVADGVAVGEVRRISLQSTGIYLAERRLLLRDDTTAASIASGASRLRVFLQGLWPSRCWSLHEDMREIARIQRCVKKRQDQFDLQSAGESWSVKPRSGLSTKMDLLHGGRVVGLLHATNWANDSWALSGGGLPLDLAVGLLLVTQGNGYIQRG